MGVYGSRAVTLLVLISDDVINRILKLDIQTNILVYVTRCCTDLTSKVLKERTFGQSSAVLNIDINDSWVHQILHQRTHQRAHRNFKGPFKLCNSHVFEWDTGHWPILRAHYHFGPRLSLTLVLPLQESM